MNSKTLISIFLSVILFPLVALAADDPQPSAQDKAHQEYMNKMMEQMQLMQNQMQKMQQTSDPKERQRLMKEHWMTMNKGMEMMHGTKEYPGCGMMMGGMMNGHMMNGHMKGGHMMNNDDMMMGWWNPEDTSEEAMSQRMNMMGSCMGMQQQMMQQMMQHQNQESLSNSPKK